MRRARRGIRLPNPYPSMKQIVIQVQSLEKKS